MWVAGLIVFAVLTGGCSRDSTPPKAAAPAAGAAVGEKVAAAAKPAFRNLGKRAESEL